MEFVVAGSFEPFLAPQLEQKFVVLSAPQLHFQLSGGAGFLLPQPEQKLPVLTAPQLQAELKSREKTVSSCSFSIFPHLTE